MTTTCLYGAKVFDGRRMIAPGGIVFDDSGILAVYEGRDARSADRLIYAKDLLIMPGLVDLHSDALEKHIEMRPGVYFDPAFALQSLDNRLAACGVTCFCHAITFGDERSGVRSLEEALRMVKLIRAFATEGVSPVRHLIHARYEITGMDNLQILIHLLDAGMLDMVSIMDHTPGQGQFKSFETYKDYYGKTYALSDTELLEMIDRKKEKRADGWTRVRDFLSRARQRQLPILSHDDDTERKVDLVYGLGVTAAEFPVSMEAALAATGRGMAVFMGAPNLLRGKSTNGNLSAAEAITRDACKGMVSDYYPESLIQAAFKTHRSLARSQANALALVTSGPGAYLDPRGGIGFLKPAARADLVVVAETRPWVTVVQTWVGGRCVYTCHHPHLQGSQEDGSGLSMPSPELLPRATGRSEEIPGPF